MEERRHAMVLRRRLACEVQGADPYGGTHSQLKAGLGEQPALHEATSKGTSTADYTGETLLC